MAHPQNETKSEKAAAREEARLDALDAKAEAARVSPIPANPPVARDAADARLDAKVDADRVANLTPAEKQAESRRAGTPAAFPERTEGFPKLRTLPSITVNGNVFGEKAGVKAEMTSAEIAGLDKIRAEMFVSLKRHNSVRKDGTVVMTDANQAIRIEDGDEFVAVGRG